MRHRGTGFVLALVIIVALLLSACAPSAAPTPTPQPKAPEKAPVATATAPSKEAPAASPTSAPAATPAPAAAKPVSGPLPEKITFGTHATTSLFYKVGAGLAKVASDAGPIGVIVQPFTGPPAWIPQMTATNVPEVGIINGFDAYQAFTGKATPKPLPEGISVASPYDKAWSKLRILLSGTTMSSGMVVRKDSKYQNMEDLRGARVTSGFKAFPAGMVSTHANLALGGLTIKDVKEVDVADATAGVRALTEGRVDAACVSVGSGYTAEADAKVGLRFLDYSPQVPERLKAAQAIWAGGDIVRYKAGRAAGIEKETGIWSYPLLVVASVDMPDQVAYALVKVWWDNYKKLEPIDPQFEGWTPEIYVSKTATIPYHPGAIAFYKEKGVWSAEFDQNQQMLLKGELPFLK